MYNPRNTKWKTNNNETIRKSTQTDQLTNERNNNSFRMIIPYFFCIVLLFVQFFLVFHSLSFLFDFVDFSIVLLSSRSTSLYPSNGCLFGIFATTKEICDYDTEWIGHSILHKTHTDKYRLRMKETGTREKKIAKG